MTADPGKFVLARTLARRSHRTIRENLFVGVGVVHVLGTTVFTQPAAFAFGNASQRYNDLRAQFRAEALNAFNTPRFGNPATSAIFPPEGPLPSQPTRRAKSKWG